MAKSTIQRIEQGDGGVSLRTLFSYIKALAGAAVVQSLIKSFEELPASLVAERNLENRKKEATALLRKMAERG